MRNEQMLSERIKMIEVQDVSMRFRMADDRVFSLKEFVTKGLRRQLKTRDFWALKGVSFDVYQGEVMGSHWKQWRRQEHNFKSDFRHIEANRGSCLLQKQCCADVGARLRFRS